MQLYLSQVKLSLLVHNKSKRTPLRIINFFLTIHKIKLKHKKKFNIFH